MYTKKVELSNVYLVLKYFNMDEVTFHINVDIPKICL